MQSFGIRTDRLTTHHQDSVVWVAHPVVSFPGLGVGLVWGTVSGAIQINVLLFLFNVFFPMYPADGASASHSTPYTAPTADIYIPSALFRILCSIVHVSTVPQSS